MTLSVHACGGEVSMPRDAAPPVVVRGVDVVIRTPSGLAVRRDRDVWIEDGRVARILSAGQGTDGGPEAVAVDGEGRTLLPGLVDLNVLVLDPVDLDRALAAGVTTMRCLDSYGWLPEEIRARHAAGVPTPRCVVFGPDLRRTIAGRGERGVSPERKAAASGEVERRMLEQRDAGYAGSTLGPDAPPWLVEAALRASARHRVPLALDVPGKLELAVALSSGGPLGSLEAAFGPWLAWRRVGFVHDAPGEAAVAKALNEVRSAGVTVATGLSSIDIALDLLENREHVRAWEFVRGSWADGVRCQGPLDRETLLRVSPLVRAIWSPAAHQMRRALPLGFAPRLRAARGLLDEAAVRFDAAGVRLAIASGAGRPFQVVGSSTVDEIERVIEAGVGPERALEAATWNGAQALGREGLGEIREGAPADLLLVEGDPLADSSALRRPVGVFVGGRYVPREESDTRARAEEERAARELDFVVSVTLLQNVDRAIERAGTPPRETTLRTLCEVYVTHDVPRPRFARALAEFAATRWPEATWPARFQVDRRPSGSPAPPSANADPSPAR